MAQYLKKPSVKSKVEAVIFSTGHKMSIDEISRLCRSRREEVLAALQELKKEYDEKQSSLMLVDEGDFWKFTVRDHFIPMVRKIVTETELSKSVMETMAVIAFKYPILQSDLIKIRTNKAYDHLMELEKSGYISRQKHGRTNLIKLTEKFFKYFDLTEEKLKEQFKDFDSIAKAIKEKEVEVEQIKEDQRKKAEELKKEDEKIKKEIESLDESEEQFEVPLEAYGIKSKEMIFEEFEKEGSLIVEKEKIGELEVVEASQEKHAKKGIIQHMDDSEIQVNEVESAQPLQTETSPETKSANEIQNRQVQHPKKQKRGIKLTPEMEKEVDKKVDEMLNPKEGEKK